ncbi:MULTISPECIES: helix-turn-helix domain-containing protein [Nocardiaceae]|uniref:helix-turn-helix domain-containing protein n=1 Tax=Nocardiaceae TaxID=85025 RepID=UPI001E53AA8D|nr:MULTISPECIES: helix-turn-helix domain-containing protein [Rhodococcus]MCC8927238.1 helix-turn-helix domain-containing protein [Rhodococcus sp. I2R]MCZ4275096.1 helix-turn-helix domain-containing protein [Rhodococcus yunnanensis]
MTQATEPTGMLSTTFFDRFPQGEHVTHDEHVRVFWGSPSIKSTELAVEYLMTARGVPVTKGIITSAVRNGELTAYRIGPSNLYRPADLDTWLESRKVGA